MNLLKAFFLLCFPIFAFASSLSDRYAEFVRFEVSESYLNLFDSWFDFASGKDRDVDSFSLRTKSLWFGKKSSMIFIFLIGEPVYLILRFFINFPRQAAGAALVRGTFLLRRCRDSRAVWPILGAGSLWDNRRRP